jgi:hypothetical protein
MKRYLFALPLLLASCATPVIPPAPSEIADKTILDEQGALGAELAYKAARTAAELAVDAGVLKGTRASQVAALDRKAYAALLAVRTAYRAGNATAYDTALTEARSAVSQILTLIGS